MYDDTPAEDRPPIAEFIDQAIGLVSQGRSPTEATSMVGSNWGLVEQTVETERGPLDPRRILGNDTRTETQFTPGWKGGGIASATGAQRTPSAPSSRPSPSLPSSGPKVGQVVDGYRFMGGDPSDQNNWKPVS